MSHKVTRTLTRAEQRKIRKENAGWERVIEGKKWKEQEKKSMGKVEQKKEGVKRRKGIKALKEIKK